MKGRTRRKKTWFRKGNMPPLVNRLKCHGNIRHRSIKRSNTEVHDFIKSHTDNGLLVKKDSHGDILQAELPKNNEGNPMDLTMLRPTEKKEYLVGPKPAETDYDNTYGVFHKGKLCDMWNKAFQDHGVFKSNCTGELKWDNEASEKRGLAWAMVLKCSRCSFKTAKTKLYDEVDTQGAGRKAATVNTGLQIGLSKQGISNTGIREVLVSANINPGSRRSMQDSANTVAAGIIEANTQDMNAITDYMQDLNTKIGRARSHPIPAEADGTYNNRIYGAPGNTPFQAGTQATFLVAENLTADKKIISAKTYSKLCSCSVNRNDPIHSTDCTANLEPYESIGNEGAYLTDAITDLNDRGVQIGDLTIDGDSSSRHAALEIIQPHGANVTPKYCTRHLTRVLEKHVQKTNFSKNMFTGGTKTEQDRVKNRFAFDMGDRINAEYNSAHAALSGEVTALQQALPNISDAIIACYSGDCHGCSNYSYVCSIEKPWFRSYLDTNPKYKLQRALINPSPQDIIKLKQAISIRFSDAAIEKTSTNTTQNKCEACNRGIKKAVPNSLTFRRNYHARVQSAVHSINNGPGTSIALLCQQVGAPIPAKSPVITAMKEMDRGAAYNKLRKKSPQYKESRRAARQDRYRTYDTARNLEEYYIKDGAKQDVYDKPQDIASPQPSTSKC